MAIPSSITDLDTNEAMNSPAGSDNVGGTLDNFLRSHAAIIRRQFSKGADINSASTTVIPPDCSFANVKKVASTINGFSGNFNGRIVYLKFDAGITLAHSSALVMPAGVSVVTETNDIVCFMNESPGVWKCLSYPRYTDADHPGPEPAITWPLMRWWDLSNSVLKIRDAADSKWIVRGAISPSSSVSASGIAVDFTDIPPWANRITVMLFGVSTNGAHPILIQLGAGGLVSSSYVSQTATVQSTGSGAGYSGIGFLIEDSGGAVFARYGTATLTRHAENRWIMQSMTAVDLHSVPRVSMAAGAVNLPGSLDTVRITNVATDTFDAGLINISWE